MKLMPYWMFVPLLAAHSITMTPEELIIARSIYRRVSTGPAARFVPVELGQAHETLIQAERSFMNNPQSYQARDLAYVAQYQSELAGALGSLAADNARQAKAKAKSEYQKMGVSLLKPEIPDVSDSPNLGRSS